ncbi:thioester-forming surface-anchored protein [Corynebacterium incognita]|uniref:Thioester-forming surface-anchored protein n=1 Tax=Corynebacterium incognita TaxID=2754725 RepID=A0A7G7CMB9_9CORY|nr:thioester-forming surface-anchored protein [Corynebacterium incognita]
MRRKMEKIKTIWATLLSVAMILGVATISPVASHAQTTDQYYGWSDNSLLEAWTPPGASSPDRWWKRVLYVGQENKVQPAELVYCFNENKPEPTGAGTGDLYTKTIGDAELFAERADGEALSPEELKDNVLRVLYNGYPNDAAGIQQAYGLTDLEYNAVTQLALYKYTDDMAFRKSTFDSYPERKTLMWEAYNYLIGTSVTGATVQPPAMEDYPADSTLELYQSNDGDVQDLLGVTFVNSDGTPITEVTPTPTTSTTTTTDVPVTETVTVTPTETVTETLPAETTTVGGTTETVTEPVATVTETQPDVTETEPGATVTETQPDVTETEPGATVTETQPDVTETEPGATVTETQPDVTETEPGATVTETQPDVTETEPGSTVTETQPDVTETEPGSTVTETQPDVTETEPGATVTETQPDVTETEPGSTVTETQPDVTETEPGSTVTETAPAVTTTETLPAVTVTETQPTVTVTEAPITETVTEQPTTTTSETEQPIDGGDDDKDGSSEGIPWLPILGGAIGLIGLGGLVGGGSSNGSSTADKGDVNVDVDVDNGSKASANAEAGTKSEVKSGAKSGAKTAAAEAEETVDNAAPAQQGGGVLANTGADVWMLGLVALLMLATGGVLIARNRREA